MRLLPLLFTVAVFAASFAARAENVICHCAFVAPNQTLITGESVFSDFQTIKGDLACSHQGVLIYLESDFSSKPKVALILHRGAPSKVA
jgi:hypothetical protein